MTARPASAMHSTDIANEPERVKLAAQHLELVKILAARLYRLRWGDEVSFDDYYQSGVVGLLEAATRYDAGKGIKFSTFASPRITGSILNNLLHASEMHEQIHARKHLLSQRIAAISELPPPNEVSSDPLVRLAEAAIGLAIGFMLENSAMYRAGNEQEWRDGYFSSALLQTSERLRKHIQQLTPREQQVIERHYYGHIAFEEIAMELGLTKGRVSQLHSSGLKRLRTLMGSTNFHDFEA